MAHHKLILEDDLEEPFDLIAVHCGEEEYKMAFLLNRHLHLSLRRRASDLDFSTGGLLITFPVYDYMDTVKDLQYYLVANTCHSGEVSLQSSGSLFSDSVEQKDTLHYLVPEFKKVDYLLKIYSDSDAVALDETIFAINKIKEVISAYRLDVDQIKSKNNLIFD